jgi:hypothetical protein
MSIGGVDPNNVEEILNHLNVLTYESLEEIGSWMI